MTSNRFIESNLFRLLLVLGLPTLFLGVDLTLGLTPLDLPSQILCALLLAILGLVVTLQIEVIQKSLHASDYQKDLGEMFASLKTRFETQHEALDIINSYVTITDDKAHGHEVKVLFAKRMLADATRTLKTLASEHSYEMEVRSPAKQYSSRWIDALDSLMGTDGQFKTITNAVVWSKKYLGFVRGESPYLTNQIKAAERNGFIVKRLFVVPEVANLHKDPAAKAEIKQILKEYQQAVKGRSKMLCRVLELDAGSYVRHFGHLPSDIEEIVRGGWSENYAVWGHDRPHTVNLVKYDPDPSSALGWEIEAITFLCHERVAKLCSDYFDRSWDVAKTLESYQELLDGSDPASAGGGRREVLIPQPRGGLHTAAAHGDGGAGDGQPEAGLSGAGSGVRP
jgi:hypothetical protein